MSHIVCIALQHETQCRLGEDICPYNALELGTLVGYIFIVGHISFAHTHTHVVKHGLAKRCAHSAPDFASGSPAFSFDILEKETPGERE